VEKRKCTRCKEEKPIERFNFKRKSLGVRQCQCKDCTRFLIKNHYNRNKKYYLEKTKKRNLRLRLEIFEYISRYLLKNPCVDCGESDIRVLEFDHNKNKGVKFQTVSFLIKYQYPLGKIKEEIEKCEVRCANCHRKKTAQDFNWLKNKMPL